MLTFKPLPQTIRRAVTADSKAIMRLIEDNWAVHTRLMPLDIEPKLKDYITFVVEDQTAIRGFLLVEPQPPQIGLIMTVALHDSLKPEAFFVTIMPLLEAEMRRRHLNQIMHIGEAVWLNLELEHHGFKIQDKIITFEWRQQSLPVLPPHPTMQIRVATFDDLPDLLVVDHLAFGPLWRKPHITFREALNRAATFLVATIDKSVVGYAWCDYFHDYGHLTRLGTHPAYQGQGIGSHLLCHVLQTMVDQGIDLISLNTQQHNIKSQNLYRNFGFTETLQMIDVYLKKMS